MKRAFQIYGLFTTGIGIHYTVTPIVNTKYQSFASGLVIGQRILPQVFLRAADSRPYEIQDLIVSDTRFKVLIFVGDTRDAGQRDKLNHLAEEMKGVLSPCAPGGDVLKVFDIITFGTTKKEKVFYNDVPPFFRSHWSK
jgi:phenol 2-monooxygenase